jgi:hypothetical protein
MNWLDQKYVGLLSHRLDRFTRKSSGKFNFRCPVCGDSQSSKYKARGWIYDKQGHGVFHCFNCEVSMGVPKFIRMLDQTLYNEYNMEKISQNKTPEQVDLENFVNKMKPPVFRKEGILKGLKKISQLSPDDPLKKYVANRLIPNPYHAKMFKCPNFFAFVNDLVPDKFSKESLNHDETRLLIPFINKEGKVHAIQGRSLKSTGVKYITIVLDESVEKLYGLDTVDFTSSYYVLEGPIDSMFIPNSIATAGGDIVSALPSVHKSNAVVVYDNEPRSKDTIKKIDKAIMQGFKVCIWPENLEHKDVNDMVKSGLSAEFIRYIIDQNTYKDLAAKMALTKWSKR